MEIKKSPKADLRNKRGLLLEIGLVISLCLVIGAFAYTPKERKIEKMDLQAAIVEEEIVEITRQDQKPPEPPKRVEVKVIADLLQVVTNDTKITTEVDFAEFDENTEVIQQVEVAEETIEDDQPFLIAETMPSFQGGDLNTFRNWVQQNVKFPQIALENGIQGRVSCSFVVNKDGSIVDAEVIRGVDPSLDKEALRVINSMPKWSPGKQRGKPVRVKYTVPVTFRLQ